MGGTWKQDKVARGGLYRYGEYAAGEVYLFAFPLRRREWHCKQLPRPNVVQEYERAGAMFRQEGDGWLCRFNEAVLKRFYLYDVLIHEIGHHVDRHNWRPFRGGKSYSQAERFAQWFVRQYGFRDEGKSQ
jgi:hypothetical protein